MPELFFNENSFCGFLVFENQIINKDFIKKKLSITIVKETARNFFDILFLTEHCAVAITHT